MKLKILKKSIKEGTSASGVEYCIKSLYVSFSEPEIYERIVKHLTASGAAEDKIASFCKPNEYNGTTSYAFGLGCSHFTFDAVDRFGVLDANVIFKVNDNGFINARIQIVDKKEQVNGYEAPDDFCDGWACGNPEPKKHEDIPMLNPVDVPDLSNLPPLGEEGSGLPF